MMTTSSGWSFNPCFNGSVERGSRSGLGGEGKKCFNPCFNGSVERGLWSLAKGRAGLKVSILVLMEVLREGRSAAPPSDNCALCFNPCFNGSVERGSATAAAFFAMRSGFNPCFNGSVERGSIRSGHARATAVVSILVLMEVLREGSAPQTQGGDEMEFQSLF